jgi:hypothetical protein
LVVSFCILLSDWFFFLASEWLIGRKWRLLIGQISWLLIRDLLQEALAVTLAKDQTQALNIPVKVPLGGGRYAELIEWNGSKRVDLRFWNLNLQSIGCFFLYPAF